MDSLVHKMIDMGAEDSQFNRQADAGARVMTPDEANAKFEELTEKLMKMNPGSHGYDELLHKRMEYQRLASARH